MPLVRPQVLNDAFQAAADQARQKLPKLTQNQEVGSHAVFTSIGMMREFLKPLRIIDSRALVVTWIAISPVSSCSSPFLHVGVPVVPAWTEAFEQLGY
jgi:hypothetical protein